MGWNRPVTDARSMAIITQSGPGSVATRSRTAFYARLAPPALAGTVLALVQMQLLALSTHNPLTSTLSVYVHTDGGWLFPLGLFLMAIALFASAAAVFSVTRQRVHAWLLGLAGTGSIAAAAFPADTSGDLSWVGELHRYASLVLLLLPPVVALMLVRRATDRRSVRGLSTAVLVSVVSGICFLIGFLPNLFPQWNFGDHTWLATVSGVSQRILVLAVAITVGLIARHAEQLAAAGPRHLTV
jgi:hypothetical protein